MSDSANGPTKRALLIGVDDYPHLSSSEQLKGCVNDAKAYHALLQNPFGFPEENIQLLTNEKADRDGILAAFDRLVNETGQDDIVVFQYSGHGSWCWDQEGDEPDGKDETIVPYDSGRRGRDNRDITDDEIQLRLLDLADKTGNITLIFDSCHSGTITREVFEDRARSLPGAGEHDNLPPALKERDRDRLNESLRQNGPSGWLAIGNRYVLMAGCRDEERSYEHQTEDGDEPVIHGAMTYFLCQALLQSTSGTTYRDVFTRVKSKVTAAKSQQHPQIEGTLDREIFGIRDIEPLQSIRVTNRSGKEVTLAGGSAHGMTKGSKWSIHETDAREPTDENQLGMVVIRSVRATESTAAIEDEPTPDSIEEGTQAVEREHSYGDMALKVSVISKVGATGGAEAAVTALRGSIESADILRLARDGEEANAAVYLLAPGEEAAALSAGTGGESEDGGVTGIALPASLIDNLDGPTWVVVTGQMMLPPKPIGEHENVADNLEKYARYQHAMALDNPKSSSALRDSVKIELLRKRADDEWVVAEPEAGGGDVVFEEGEAIAFRVDNKHTDDVFVNLVDFGLTGKVSPLYPIPGAQDAFAKGKHTIGAWGLGFPDAYPFAENEYMASPDEGTETFKFFVTTDPADFSFLKQDTFRSLPAAQSAGVGNPLELLMRSAAGTSTRDAGPQMMSLDDQDWTTISHSFVLRRKSTTALDPAGQRITLGNEKNGVSVTSNGLGGTVRDHGWGSAKAAVSEMAEGSLLDSLKSAGVEIRNTIEIEAETSPSARSLGEPPSIELEVRDAGAGWGQLVMSTDEAGAVRWHFAQEPEATPAGEGTRSLGGGTARYVIDGDVIPSPADHGDAAHRGLVGAVGKKFLKVLVFKLVDPLLGMVGAEFAGRWEAAKRPYGVRTFTPDDYAADSGAAIDGSMWEKLSGGPALLMVHGTFSRAHNAFGGMSRELVERLHAKYDGRVFAFDHYTLSETPQDNIEWLLRNALPDGIKMDLDVICHSRGGLVSRVLSEKSGELDMGSRKVGVDKVIFAGSPNAGTALADPKHIDALINSYTNLLNFFPDNGVTDVLDAIITTLKTVAVGAFGGLKGIQSMVPGGKFEEWLNARGDGTAKYFAMASDYEPSESGLKEYMKNQLMDRIFKDVGGNDLVVPTASVYKGTGAGQFPIPEERRLVFTQHEAVGHSGYFGSVLGRKKILEWLDTERAGVAGA